MFVDGVIVFADSNGQHPFCAISVIFGTLFSLGRTYQMKKRSIVSVMVSGIGKGPKSEILRIEVLKMLQKYLCTKVAPCREPEICLRVAREAGLSGHASGGM